MYLAENTADNKPQNMADQGNRHLESALPTYVRAVAVGSQFHGADIVVEWYREFRNAILKTIWRVECNDLPNNRGPHCADP